MIGKESAYVAWAGSVTVVTSSALGTSALVAASAAGVAVGASSRTTSASSFLSFLVSFSFLGLLGGLGFFSPPLKLKVLKSAPNTLLESLGS